jgi:replicative DNA helicase
MSVLELRAKSRRLKARFGIQAIFVDYLQLMSSPGRQESRQQEVSQISRGIKALARELNLPVVVLAQLNRNPEGRTDGRPRMSDLRESGAIEQDADVIMLLHREDYYKKENCPEELRGVSEVIVDKQRNGPTGIVKLFFNNRYTRFDNYAPNAGGFVPDYAGSSEPALPAPTYNADGPGYGRAETGGGDDAAPF